MSDNFRFRSHLRMVGLPDGRTTLVSGDQPLLVFSGVHGELIYDLYEAFTNGIGFNKATAQLKGPKKFQARELLHFLRSEGAVVIGSDAPETNFKKYKDILKGGIALDLPILQILSDSAVGKAVEWSLSDTDYCLRTGSSDFSSAELCFVDCTSVGYHAARELNKTCLKMGLCCLYTYRSNVNETVIGPLVIPGVTACLECYIGRWLGNANYVSDRILRGPDDVHDIQGPAAIDRAAGSAISLQVIQHFDHTAAPSTWNGVILMDHQRGTSERHHILKVPQCKSCSLTGRY